MVIASTVKMPATSIADYVHSPVHYAVVLGDHIELTRLLSSLPKLIDPEEIHTESDSVSQEQIAEQISAVLDRRDVPFRETPLHLAVRLNDVFAVKKICTAGADITLQNAAGWSALHEALCRRRFEVTKKILRHQHRLVWCKWRRRLPRLIAVLRLMRDFYMEISFNFESSVIPLVGKIAPSDTYKIWKRDGNLRADTSLAGFDGLKIHRADQSFLFLGDGYESLDNDISQGTLLVLNREDRTILDAFESARSPISKTEIKRFCSQTKLRRPGMDVTKAELVQQMNWRRQEKTETIGDWKSKIYDVHNVSISSKSRKVVAGEIDLENDNEDKDGIVVVEKPSFSKPLRHRNLTKEYGEFQALKRSVSLDSLPIMAVPVAPLHQFKEKEHVKSLRPSVWLTDDFPLKTEELLPLLDILANHVKAVRRMRELLTTKLPAGTFPVKLSIPVVPTVKVVITFTKFVHLPAAEHFYSPLSSPSFLSAAAEEQPDEESEVNIKKRASVSRLTFSTSSWLRRRISGKSVSSSGKSSKQRPEEEEEEEAVDPFTIPEGYKWKSNSDSQINQVISKINGFN